MASKAWLTPRNRTAVLSGAAYAAARAAATRPYHGLSLMLILFRKGRFHRHTAARKGLVTSLKTVALTVWALTPLALFPKVKDGEMKAIDV